MVGMGPPPRIRVLELSHQGDDMMRRGGTLETDYIMGTESSMMGWLLTASASPQTLQRPQLQEACPEVETKMSADTSLVAAFILYREK